jgi:ATP-dependent HslUV protease ATP-binding subunit HslU
MDSLTPRQIVQELDKYIVGQDDAKRAVAVAIRNRYRRRLLDDEMREEVIPKNILMIGPTGVGKTEIARRLANLVGAPFIKVEATKFTEVGYVGRDVDAIIRDLVEVAIRMVESEKMAEVEDRAAALAEERLLDLLQPLPKRKTESSRPPLLALAGSHSTPEDEASSAAREEVYQRELQQAQRVRELTARRLRAGELEDEMVEVEVQESVVQNVQVFSPMGVEEMGFDLQDILGNIFPPRVVKRRVTVAEARDILTQEEAQKLVDFDSVVREAIGRVEEGGIVFLDELDKIAGRERTHGPDVSREGVQRDILPIVEGSTVATKHGPVNTQHILFIAAGAFHMSKPSDLIPELQGRFPIRVELKSLSQEDFKRILTEPKNALIKQYKALLKAEDVDLEFTEDAIDEIARIASVANQQAENIGARRLHTVLERLLEEVSFHAPDMAGQKHVVDRDYVRRKLEDVIKSEDLSKYML